MGETSRLEDLKRRVEADPASIAFASLAEEYRRAARFDEAVEASRAGLRFHPTYVSARVTLGRSLMELALYDQAERELHVVARSTPDNLAARRALGDLYWAPGAESRSALEQMRWRRVCPRRRRAAGCAGAGIEVAAAAAGRGAVSDAAHQEAAARRLGSRGPSNAGAVLPAIVPAGQPGRPLDGRLAPHPVPHAERPRRDAPASRKAGELTADPRRCHGAVVTHPCPGHARVARPWPLRRRRLISSTRPHQYLTGLGHAGVLADGRSIYFWRLPLQARGRTAGPDGIAPPNMGPYAEGSNGYDRRLANWRSGRWPRVGSRTRTSAS